MKHICKRDLLRNAANSLSAEPTMVTKHGQPEYFVSKVDTVENLQNTITTLQAFQASLGGAIGSVRSTATDLTNPQPIITKGGVIRYEKKHSHK